MLGLGLVHLGVRIIAEAETVVSRPRLEEPLQVLQLVLESVAHRQEVLSRAAHLGAGGLVPPRWRRRRRRRNPPPRCGFRGIRGRVRGRRRWRRRRKRGWDGGRIRRRPWSGPRCRRRSTAAAPPALLHK